MDEKTKTVLVVDDTPDNIDVLCNILEENYSVKVATSGKIALKIITSGTLPDLVILDVLMPEMDGFEVCRRIKTNEDTKNIPVIFATASINAEKEQEGLDAGGADFIKKPFDPDAVLERLSHFI